VLTSPTIDRDSQISRRQSWERAIGDVSSLAFLKECPGPTHEYNLGSVIENNPCAEADLV